MSPKLRRFLIGLVGVLVVFAILGGLAFNTAVKASFPQTSGENQTEWIERPRPGCA